MSDNEEGVKEKKRGVNCFICSDELRNDHTNVRCPQGHHLCQDCSRNFVDGIMSDGLLPPKCGLCGTQIANNVFEMNVVSANHREQFIMFNASMTIGEGEKLVTCPSCSWFAISFNEPPLFLKCQGDCQNLSCHQCKTILPDPVRRPGDEEILEQHFAHGDPQLVESYDLWMKAVDTCKVQCPNENCNVGGGLKDDACLHMTCNACSFQYCYFCQLPVEETDQATPRELQLIGQPDMSPVYRHNVDWVNNASRCPMYLTQIHEFDERWPQGNDDACVQRLSRLRVLKALREAYWTMGENGFERLRRAFGRVEATLAAYPMADILSAETDPKQWIRGR